MIWNHRSRFEPWLLRLLLAGMTACSRLEGGSLHSLDNAGFSAVNGRPRRRQIRVNETESRARALPTSTAAMSGGFTSAARPHGSWSLRRREDQPPAPGCFRGPLSRAHVQELQGMPRCIPQTTPCCSQPLRRRAGPGRVRSHSGPHLMSHSTTTHPRARRAAASVPLPLKTSTKIWRQ